MNIKCILEQVKNGSISLEEAEKSLTTIHYEDMGFAKIDHNRKARSGFGEVIFCQGKSQEHLIQIYDLYFREGEEVLGTRASQEQYEWLKEQIPTVKYDPLSRILKIENETKQKIGKIAV